MKHHSLNEIAGMVEIMPFARTQLTRSQKLERWADVVERHRGSIVALQRVEYLPQDEQVKLRGDGTPLALAYQDGVLREEGLAGDTLGDAMKFFELSDREAHRLLCDCHYYGAMSTELVARHLRALAKGGIRGWFA